MDRQEPAPLWLIRSAWITCILVTSLFFFGGLVRATGSGMGCPDWPKCFGKVIPPTDSLQLPANYQQIFLEKRIQKLQKFTKVLDAIGMHDKAREIQENKSILAPEAFNTSKAWTEYINRIFGVLSGFAGLWFFLLSFKYRRQFKGLFLFSSLSLLFLILNAWLGSFVVATNLLPGMVTFHFLLSFICIFLIVYALHKVKPFQRQSRQIYFGPTYKLLFLLIVVEVILGSISRELVEQLRLRDIVFTNNQLNYKDMGNLFMVHRFTPALLLAFTAAIWYKYRKIEKEQMRDIYILGALILLQICIGAFNIVLKLPAWSQTGHILIGSILPVYIFILAIAKPVHKAVS